MEGLGWDYGRETERPSRHAWPHKVGQCAEMVAGGLNGTIAPSPISGVTRCGVMAGPVIQATGWVSHSSIAHYKLGDTPPELRTSLPQQGNRASTRQVYRAVAPCQEHRTIGRGPVSGRRRSSREIRRSAALAASCCDRCECASHCSAGLDSRPKSKYISGNRENPKKRKCLYEKIQRNGAMGHL